MTPRQQNKLFFSALALIILPISGLSIDIYVPSLPAVSAYFGVDKALVQLTITTYMLGLGVMQLFAGSISDSFGRKRPFIVAMLIYIFSTLLIPLSQEINQLLILRFVQGSAVALTIVPMRSVVADLFEGRELRKMMTYMTMSWSMGPIIAPAIGGYLQHYFGWQASFYLLVIYASVMLIITWIFLPETSQYRHVFHIGKSIGRYRDILLNVNYDLAVLINGALYSFIILFSVVGPFLIQNVLHYSPVDFGHIALLMGLAWFLGTMTNRMLIDVPLGMRNTIGFLAMFAVAMSMIIVGVLTDLNIYNIVIPIAILFWLGGSIFPSYFARSVELFPQMSGSANALYGASVFLLTGISSALGTLLKSSSEVPLACAYLALIIFCFVCFYADTIKSRSQIIS